MNPVYPWSAVVGQESLKRALVLCAIDPGIGGVLVEGPRGVAKTTLARALADLVPGTFVELPLGATEERVTGTLALDTALREGRVEFAPGLLARAHEGVLYVDEVNLLGDSLVDVLLDAAATGRNTVERDGVSHTHAARFVLVGTMNPEEGALRPQLIDRFGLAVAADGELTPAQRAEIVLRRLEFDRDPQGFVARFAKEQARFITRCAQARAHAQAIPLAGAGLERVTELCHAASVEGVRADLAMLRAARAHAAWHERMVITAADVDAVAELALAHRRRRSDREPPPSGSHGGSPPPQRGPNGGTGSSNHGSFSADAGDTAASTGTAGALPPVPVRAAAPPVLPSRLVAAEGALATTRRGGSARVRAQRGARPRGRAQHGAIDWFGTLARNRKPRIHDLRYHARRSAPEQLWIVALDCSSSMLRGGALAAAKGVAQAIEAAAVHAGAHVALISFRGPAARTEATTSAGRGQFGRAITLLGGGGGTPLREALLEAERLCARPTFRSPAIPKRLFLITDGRTREKVSDLLHARRGIALSVIDCERGHVRLGRARPLADALRGSYVHVDGLTRATQ